MIRNFAAFLLGLVAMIVLLSCSAEYAAMGSLPVLGAGHMQRQDVWEHDETFEDYLLRCDKLRRARNRDLALAVVGAALAALIVWACGPRS